MPQLIRFFTPRRSGPARKTARPGSLPEQAVLLSQGDGASAYSISAILTGLPSLRDLAAAAAMRMG